MEVMEEAMGVDLMVTKEAIIMILINLDIKVMGMDIIRAIGIIEQKMLLIVVHVLVQLAVRVVFFQCVCVDFYELIFTACVYQKKFIILKKDCKKQKIMIAFNRNISPKQLKRIQLNNSLKTCFILQYFSFSMLH